MVYIHTCTAEAVSLPYHHINAFSHNLIQQMPTPSKAHPATPHQASHLIKSSITSSCMYIHTTLPTKKTSSSQPSTDDMQWKKKPQIASHQEEKAIKNSPRSRPRRILNDARHPAVQWRSRIANSLNHELESFQEGKYERRKSLLLGVGSRAYIGKWGRELGPSGASEGLHVREA